MKKSALSILLFIALSISAFAQKEVKTITITVNGICGMCEERIENALDVRGVKAAEWDRKTHQCVISYRTDKISEDELHQLLNDVGHDTEKSTASAEAYDSVHSCCKYREHEDH